MKTIIFILAISALAAPIFTAACTANPAPTGSASCETGGTVVNACVAGYYLTTAKACALCGGGKGKAAGATGDAAATGSADNSVCDVVCTGNCETCTTAASCLNCKAGYYLGAAGSCSMCPSGKGKAADTTVPAVDGNGATCANCATGIASCKGTTANDALYCLANYWYANNACTACDMGKAKAAGTATPATAEAATSCAICPANKYYTATGCMDCPAAKPTRTAPTTAPNAVENDSVCSAAGGSGSSATLIQAICGASVAAYALF